MATSDGSDIPREPSAYSPSLHFAERFRDRYDEFNRHLDGEIVAGCIEDGTATVYTPHKVQLHETFGGVEYRLVVNPARGSVVSGYPVDVNEHQARESGRWSESELQDIREFLAQDPDDR